MELAYAFVTSVEEAHRVASHIFRTWGPGACVGFNESSCGEGYVAAERTIDLAQIIRDVTGVEPLRVLTTKELVADPDMWGIQAEPASSGD